MKSCCGRSVNKARQGLFSRNACPIENKSPTRAALLQHIRRALYQEGLVWGNAFVDEPQLPRWRVKKVQMYLDRPQCHWGLSRFCGVRTTLSIWFEFWTDKAEQVTQCICPMYNDVRFCLAFARSAKYFSENSSWLYLLIPRTILFHECLHSLLQL